MSEPVNWLDRLEGITTWGQRHPFLAKLLGGAVFTVGAAAMLVWKVKTTGHE